MRSQKIPKPFFTGLLEKVNEWKGLVIKNEFK